MNRGTCRLWTVLIVSVGWAIPTSAADGRRDLGSEVLAVFSAKCAGCHGPNLAKPTGRFGYVLDLARVAGNPELVIPSSPQESELWEHVYRDEMPPADAPSGPLSAEQKEVIRAWIAAGAPKAASAEASEITPLEAENPGNLQVMSAWSFAQQALGRVGSLHVVVVHFPVALLIAAAVGELWCLGRGGGMSSPAVRFCVLLGAASALAAVVLGWLHASHGHGADMPATLGLHRWTGTVAALWAIGTGFFSEWDEHRGVRSPWFRAWLLFGALLVAAAGHFGGVLVHGEDFLSGG